MLYHFMTALTGVELPEWIETVFVKVSSADRRPGFGGGGVVMKHPRLRSDIVITTTFRKMRLTDHIYIY